VTINIINDPINIKTINIHFYIIIYLTKSTTIILHVPMLYTLYQQMAAITQLVSDIHISK